MNYTFKFVLAVTDKDWRAYGYEETATEEWRDVVMAHAKQAELLYNPAPGNYLVDAILENGVGNYVFHLIEDPDLKL